MMIIKLKQEQKLYPETKYPFLGNIRFALKKIRLRLSLT